MRHRIAFLVAILAVVAAGLYAGGPYVACYVVQPIRERFWTPPRNTPDCGAGMPSLTSGQKDAAQKIALADPRVREILGNSAYTTGPVGVWVAGSCLIGAVQQFNLSEPQTITMDWLFVRWNESNDRPVYPASTLRATAIGLTNVTVSVDLGRHEVEQVLPGGSSRIVEPLTPDVVLRRVWWHLTYCPE